MTNPLGLGVQRIQWLILCNTNGIQRLGRFLSLRWLRKLPPSVKTYFGQKVLSYPLSWHSFYGSKCRDRWWIDLKTYRILLFRPKLIFLRPLPHIGWGANTNVEKNEGTNPMSKSHDLGIKQGMWENTNGWFSNDTVVGSSSAEESRQLKNNSFAKICFPYRASGSFTRWSIHS